MVALTVTAVTVGPPDAGLLRSRVADAGLVAPALFVLYALVTLLPLPKNVVAPLRARCSGWSQESRWW